MRVIDFYSVARTRWLQCGFIMLLPVVIAITYLWYATPVYKSEATIMLPDLQSGGGTVDVGGVGILAGLGFGKGSGIDRAVQVLSSRRNIAAFIVEADIYKDLYFMRWGLEEGRWVDHKLEPKPQPDYRFAVDFFRNDVLSFNVDTKSGVIVISLRGSDPVKVASWLKHYIEFSNDTYTAGLMTQARARVANLERELNNSQLVATSSALSRLIEREYESIALYGSSNQNLVVTVDEASIPYKKSSPLVFAVLAGGGVCGVVLTLIFLMVVLAKADRREV
jgi:uncharacterized protein involved in exopolysaccharide biosynthesis